MLLGGVLLFFVCFFVVFRVLARENVGFFFGGVVSKTGISRSENFNIFLAALLR